MSYPFWKLLHIASVVIFLGNILTGLFWAAQAKRSRNFSLIASTFDAIIRSDRLFTMPGVIGILVAGVVAAIHAKLPLLGTGWIFWSIVMFTISGVVFGLQIAPLQRRLAAHAHASKDTEQSWSEFDKLYKKWEIWGLVALATPVIAFVIMVLKPALPAL